MCYPLMVVSIGSFQQYYIDTHIHLSFNVSHLIQKWKKKLFFGYCWLMSLSLMWITLPVLLLSQITNYVCLAHIKHLSVKRINMCMQNRDKFGDTFAYLALTKRYLRLLKNLQFCDLRYPMFFNCIRRGIDILS